MGLIVGIVKSLVKLLLYFIIFAGIVVIIPNLPPYTTFSSVKLEPSQARTGPLAPNEALNNPKLLYKNKLLGPEAFAKFDGELYTSLATGEIVKITPGGHVTFVTKVGQPCTGLTREHICGRPLGFEIDEKTNTLYVADAYLGIWKVNLKTDKKQLLVSPNVAIDGKVPKLFNSVVIGKNGDLYWTDSTSDFHLKDGAMSLLADPSGRFFYYNAAKNESKVLLDNLWFPNGLAISPDNQFVLISETCKYRVIKYYIDGPKKGKSEIFVSGLPGSPDNLRALPDGSGVLIALYTVFDETEPLLSRSMSETPLVRKFLVRIAKLIETPFEYLNSLYPHIILEEIVYNIGHFSSVSRFASHTTGLVYMDWNGNIIESYYNTDRNIYHISDAIVYGDRLYTGSPHKQDFIGSVPAPPALKKAFTTKKAEHATKPVPKADKSKQEEPKVTKPVVAEPPKQKPIEKPKPITEKPKPVTEKPVTEKPVVKPVTEKPKPVTEKPIEKKVETPRTIPKPVQQPPKATPAPKTERKVSSTTEPKTTTPPPNTKPKQEAKTTPKPATKSMNTETKPTESTTAKPEKLTPKAETKPVKDNKPETIQKQVKEVPKAPEQIPIKEDIPSDTEKPAKEKLKVIKKGGPTEIPNINNV